MIKVGGYVRLSRDDDMEKYASIEAQKSIITDFVKNKGWQLVKFYEDDDITGYKFNSREGFNQLLQDLENDKIDAVCAKDLSRIGRHQAYTLLFIEQIQAMNKILIAIDDNFDSTKEEDQTLVGIRSWYNEMYVKDLSKKIRSNIANHMKNNRYLNQAPYGYIVDEITNNYVIDEEAKPIIEKIFNLYINGYGILKIARILNEEGIPTPVNHMKKLAEKEGKVYKLKSNNKWLDSTVMSILKNDAYIGTKRLGKTKRDKIHGKRRVTNETEQYVFENNHPAIISKKDFELVQQIMQKRKIQNYRGNVKHNNIYTGFLYCNECNNTLIARSQTGRAKSYICRTYKNFGKNACSIHYIKEEDITKVFIDMIETAYKNADLISDIFKKKMEDIINLKKDYDKLIKKHYEQLDDLKQKHKILLSQKINALAKNPDMGKTIEAIYDEQENEILSEIKRIDEKIKNLINDKENIMYDIKNIDFKQFFKNILDNPEIRKSDLELLVDKIIVDENKVIKIKMKKDFEIWFNDYLSQEHLSMLQEPVHIINAINLLGKYFLPSK